MNTKNQENDSTRERILSAAKKKFAQKGFLGARMGEIAEEAEVNKSLIHYYFANKETLYRQVVSKAFGLGQRQEISIYAGKWPLSTSQKLYIIFYFIIHLTLRARDRDMYRLLFWEIVEGNTFHEQGIKEFVIPIYSLIIGIIREGTAKGEFETRDPQLLTMFTVFSIFHYNLDKEIMGETPVFKELYGDKSDNDIFMTLIENLFKTLCPHGKPLQVPVIPDELQQFLNRLIDTASSESKEGYAEELLWKIREVLAD